MSKHTPRRQKPFVSLQVIALGVLSVVSSFAVGIRTAGDIETIELTSANDLHIAGDMNADGIVEISDVLAILEIAQGYEIATPDQLLSDPNGDGELTVEDAMRVLSDIESL
jgi:hypothetical protein